MPIQAIKGMNDLLPEESVKWQRLEAAARQIFSRYHYREIRTPIVESLDLFARTLGETAMIVEKEMYSFEDRRGKRLALRPEGTASVVRAYIERHLHQSDALVRLYYMGPMYRYERPQKGRYRQFHQIGVEVIGSPSPIVDAEVIHVADALFKELGLEDLELEINSLGCPVCRPDYTVALVDYLREHQDQLCDDCQRRIEKNPLRVLDCKNETCIKVAAEAPSIQDHLCEDCEFHFDAVLEAIGCFGSLYAINHRIVRGLDYYQRTAFEFTSQNLGAQNAVAGGGRYDGLVRLLGGPHVPGVGFAIGVERLAALLEERWMETGSPRPLVYIAAMGDRPIQRGITLAETLRKHDIAVEGNYEEKSLKSLMRRADKMSADYTVILGSEEVKGNKLVLRNMETQEQEELPLDQPEQVIQRVQSR
jgi:histidyl-tRNA synthetase